MNTVEKLNQLDEFQAQKALLDLDKKLMIEDVYNRLYTPEVRQALDEIKKAEADINAEFAIKSEAVDANIEKLTSEIKNEVLANGATVKGDHMMAVFAKGRVSWDTKALDGVVALHPELAQFRKEGEPSVSIRKA
jgi:uncharacterized protein YqeY